MRTHCTVVQESPEYEPQSNVFAEPSAHTIKGCSKYPKVHLHAMQVPDVHAVLTWLVRHTTCFHNRSHMGPDGCTSWERVAGKRSGTAAAEVGERVMFMTRGPNKESQWSFGPSAFGLWLATRTQEECVGTPKGVSRAWAIKRKREQDKCMFWGGIRQTRTDDDNNVRSRLGCQRGLPC